MKEAALWDLGLQFAREGVFGFNFYKKNAGKN